MNILKEKVMSTITKNNLIQNGDKLVLAVSGGPDSLAMLNVLLDIRKSERLDFEFVVAHVNHMIRKEAVDDEKFVKGFCEKNNILCFVKKVDIPKISKDKKIGTEEAGRYARYEFFDEVLDNTNSNKIAIAHNKNDKVETILMNLLRGSGVSGLKGIEYIKNGKYIRPLLDCTRKEIEDYCYKENLNPRIDKTNFDNTYTRNKVRNVVIPYVQQEFNPNIIETLNRLSELVKEEENYVDEQVEKAYNEMVIEEKLMDYVIKLCGRNVGNKYLTPNKNLKIFLNNGKIYFIDQR